MRVLEVEVFISLDETWIIVSEPDNSLNIYKSQTGRILKLSKFFNCKTMLQNIKVLSNTLSKMCGWNLMF